MAPRCAGCGAHPGGSAPAANASGHEATTNYRRIKELSEKLIRIGYTVEEPPLGPRGGRRVVITAYAPLTPLQLATMALIDAMYRNRCISVSDSKLSGCRPALRQDSPGVTHLRGPGLTLRRPG